MASSIGTSNSNVIEAHATVWYELASMSFHVVVGRQW